MMETELPNSMKEDYKKRRLQEWQNGMQGTDWDKQRELNIFWLAMLLWRRSKKNDLFA